MSLEIFLALGQTFPRCELHLLIIVLTFFLPQILKYVEKESEVEKIAAQKPRYKPFSEIIPANNL